MVARLELEYERKALCTIPRNCRQCEKASQKLGNFSAAVSRKALSFSSTVSLNLSSRISSGKLNGDRSFVFRAEAKSDEAEEAEEKPLGMPRIKFGDVIGILNKRAIEESEEVRPRPDIRTADVVEIKWEFSDKWRYSIPAPQVGKAGRGRTVGKSAGKENKKEYKIYKGIVMSRQNAGVHTTIRIRRIIAGVGVEIVFPLYSPNIKEIKVLHHRKVRRARLYYLRDKLPRFSTVK